MSRRPAYLDVPKPAAVAELPTTGLGLPVPYITAYRPHDGHEVHHTINTGRGLLCVCSCKLGEGRPMIGVQCVNRERQAMRKRLCGVCGQSLRPADDILFLGIGEAVIDNHGVSVPTSIEAPTHPECTAYSALTCPRLMRDPADVVLAVMKDYELADSILVGYDENEQPRYNIVPHGTDRRNLGALNSYVAFLRPEHGRFVPLADWMVHEAPTLA